MNELKGLVLLIVLLSGCIFVNVNEYNSNYKHYNNTNSVSDSSYSTNDTYYTNGLATNDLATNSIWVRYITNAITNINYITYPETITLTCLFCGNKKFYYVGDLGLKPGSVYQCSNCKKAIVVKEY